MCWLATQGLQSLPTFCAYTCDSQFARRSHIENEDRREVPRYLLGNIFVTVTFLASGCMKQLASCRSWRCQAFYG